MAYPTVAIIMRTQERPLTLDRALRSILGQRFRTGSSSSSATPAIWRW